MKTQIAELYTPEFQIPRGLVRAGTTLRTLHGGTLTTAVSGH